MERASGGRAIALCLAALIAWGATSAREPPDQRLGNPWFREGREAVQRAQQRVGAAANERARNVILFVGDGMSIPTVTAARILEGQRRGQTGEENLLAFERLPYTALSKTYNTDMQVPDSAGTMTAMVSGVKTKMGVLGVDDRVLRGDHSSVETWRVPTLLEEAEERGLSTGVVSTANITHATPAACYAHVPDRNWESDGRLSSAARTAGFPDIARQLIEFDRGDGIEVVLGGGRSHFLPAEIRDPEDPLRVGFRTDRRDLTEEWRARFGPDSYVWTRAQLLAREPEGTPHLLGLFESEHMRFEADRSSDRGGEPSLTEMTMHALRILSQNPKGFFLMVEAGRIDHGHHVNNAYRALDETIELSNAVRAALELTDPKETLIVVTADHGHTMSISGYPGRGNDILGLARNPARLERDALGQPYTTLSYANGPGYTGATQAQPAGPKWFPHLPYQVEGITDGRPDLSEVDTADPRYMQETTFPLLLATHSGEDVPIYAGGPGSPLFQGVQEQTYIYHAITHALGWSDPREDPKSSD